MRQHLHMDIKTWECYLADDNGSKEVEVTRTRDVDVLNVTLNSGNLMSICQDRLGFSRKNCSVPITIKAIYRCLRHRLILTGIPV